MVRGYVTLGTDQTITGAKTFTGAVTVPVPADDDSSAAPATTSYVTGKISTVQTQIADAYAAISAAYIEAGGTLDE